MRQPHTVQVVLRQKVKSSVGYTLKETGETFELPCTFRELRATENNNDGVIVTQDAYILTTHWPTHLLNDVTPLIVFRGRKYDMEGIPAVRDGSRRTAHVHIRLKFVGVM